MTIRPHCGLSWPERRGDCTCCIIAAGRERRLQEHGLNELVDKDLHPFLQLQMAFGSLTNPDDLPGSHVDDAARKPDTRQSPVHAGFGGS